MNSINLVQFDIVCYRYFELVEVVQENAVEKVTESYSILFLLINPAH